MGSSLNIIISLKCMTFSMILLLLYVTKFSPAHYDGTVSSSSVRAQTNENEPHSELNMMHHASNSTAAGGGGVGLVFSTSSIAGGGGVGAGGT